MFIVITALMILGAILGYALCVSAGRADRMLDEMEGCGPDPPVNREGGIVPNCENCGIAHPLISCEDAQKQLQKIFYPEVVPDLVLCPYCGTMARRITERDAQALLDADDVTRFMLGGECLAFCPFCGEKIEVERIEGRPDV